MVSTRANLISSFRLSWKGPRIFWCAALLLWGSVSACDTPSFQGLPFETQAEVRRNFQREVAKASEIFLGQVERVTQIREVLEQGLQIYWVRFRVRRSWKGLAKPGTLVTLKALQTTSFCGPFVPESKSYWVVWVNPGTLELNYRSTPVDAKRWTNASLPAVLEALVTQSEP